MSSAEQSDHEFARHLRLVAKAMLKGTIVPVLGAGANLCDRRPNEPWTRGRNLPSGSELSMLLADEFDCQVPDRSDLVRVSQYAELTTGEGPLYAQLREVFVQDCEIPSLHRALAALPQRMAADGRLARSQLIVTTNYDDVMERALRDAAVEFDVVRYVAKGPRRGLFVHERPDGAETLITAPNAYDAVDPKERTVVLKIHGTIDRKDEHEDSYVITEDHYIEYLTRTNPSELIPVKVLDKLVNSHFLFLGYGLRDWNLRVILHRIWALRELGWTSWAVQDAVDRLDEKLWRTRQVELHERLLSDYVMALMSVIEELIA
jgi:hypothetical protein